MAFKPNFYYIIYDILIQNFFDQKKKKKKTHTILNNYYWDQLLLEVLFKLDRRGLWFNNPVRGRVQIRGLSLKEEINVVLQEE